MNRISYFWPIVFLIAAFVAAMLGIWVVGAHVILPRVLCGIFFVLFLVSLFSQRRFR